jgi:hypothetical protein
MKYFMLMLIIFFPFGLFSQSLTGTWELVYVAPVSGDDSDPRGITNIRLHFTQDGKLYSLLPEDTLSPGMIPANYTFRNNILTIIPPEEDSVIISLSFSDPDNFSFSRDEGPLRSYRRIVSPDAANKPIEPKSLQLIYTNDTSSYKIPYDNNDYSARPFHERLRGTWEVIAYENINAPDMPPYGFLNDLWTFYNDELKVLSRIDQNEISAKYILGESEIVITPESGEVQVTKARFNEWGHLVIDSGKEIIKLKLITKNTGSIPNIPLKVVLLKLNSED